MNECYLCGEPTDGNVCDDHGDMGTEPITKTQQALSELGRAKYNVWYNKGWRHSHTLNASLDNQPGGDMTGWAWEDGYLDAATGREKFHLRECDDHGNCF